jgi:hypothetical protein
MEEQHILTGFEGVEIRVPTIQTLNVKLLCILSTEQPLMHVPNSQYSGLWRTCAVPKHWATKTYVCVEVKFKHFLASVTDGGDRKKYEGG